MKCPECSTELPDLSPRQCLCGYKVGISSRPGWKHLWILQAISCAIYALGSAIEGAYLYGGLSARGSANTFLFLIVSSAIGYLVIVWIVGTLAVIVQKLIPRFRSLGVPASLIPATWIVNGFCALVLLVNWWGGTHPA